MNKEKEFFAYIDSETYKKIKNDEFNFPDFLSAHDYPIISEAKGRECGRIRNVRFLLKSDVSDLIDFVRLKLNIIYEYSATNPQIVTQIKEVLDYFKIIREKD